LEAYKQISVFFKKNMAIPDFFSKYGVVIILLGVIVVVAIVFIVIYTALARRRHQKRVEFAMSRYDEKMSIYINYGIMAARRIVLRTLIAHGRLDPSVLSNENLSHTFFNLSNFKQAYVDVQEGIFAFRLAKRNVFIQKRTTRRSSLLEEDDLDVKVAAVTADASRDAMETHSYVGIKSFHKARDVNNDLEEEEEYYGWDCNDGELMCIRKIPFLNYILNTGVFSSFVESSDVISSIEEQDILGYPYVMDIMKTRHHYSGFATPISNKLDQITRSYRLQNDTEMVIPPLQDDYQYNEDVGYGSVPSSNRGGPLFGPRDTMVYHHSSSMDTTMTTSLLSDNDMSSAGPPPPKSGAKIATPVALNIAAAVIAASIDDGENTTKQAYTPASPIDYKDGSYGSYVFSFDNPPSPCASASSSMYYAEHDNSSGRYSDSQVTTQLINPSDYLNDDVI
jgi:hypothetical protein